MVSVFVITLKTKLFSGYNKYKEYRIIENEFKYNLANGISTIIYGLTLVFINTMMKPELNKSLKT